MIPYSAWRETEFFRLEREAFDQLNYLHHELLAILPIENDETWQSFALIHFVTRSKQLVVTVGALLRRMRSDHLKFSEIESMEIARHMNAAPGEQIVILADDSSDRFREFLIADFEALYQLGSRLLDQWTLIATSIGRISTKKAENYNKFVEYLESPLEEFCLNLKCKFEPQLIWLHMNLLIFRDNFIVHHEKPFHQSTYTAGSEEFAISFLVDPIWFTEENTKIFHSTIWEINDRAPSGVKLDSNVIKNPNYVVGHLLANVDRIAAVDRDLLRKIAKKTGFNSPTYQTICTRLFEFISATVTELRMEVAANPKLINFRRNYSEKLSVSLAK